MLHSWIERSQPPEADDPPSASTTEIERLADERTALVARVRRGIRSRHQERILQRISEITLQILSHKGDGR